MPIEFSKAPETVTLRDGKTVTIRPIRADDAPRLQALHSRLSPESIYLRFLGVRPVLPPKEARRLASVDYHTRMAFVATREEGGEEIILAVARYAAIGADKPDLAEAAIVVEDGYQGKGLGTLLMERLVAYARAHGIRAFLAEASFENDRIMQFIQRAGLPVEKKLESGVWEVRVKLGGEPDFLRSRKA